MIASYRNRFMLMTAPLCLLALAAGCATATPVADPALDGTPSSAASVVTDSAAGPVTDSAPALEARDRMVAAMRRPGHVYHRVAQRRQQAGVFSNEGTISHWLDADAGVAREALRLVLDSHRTTTPGADATASTQPPPTVSDAAATVMPEALPGKPDRMGTAAAVIAATGEAAGADEDEGLLQGDKIVVGKELFDLDKGLKIASQDLAPTCPGLSAAVSLVLGCRPGATPTWSLDSGQYRGQKALLLTVTYRIEEADEPVQVDILYLDPATYLPWGLLQTSVISYGTTEESTVRADFTHQFIPVAELPVGVFDPQSATEPTPER